MFETYTFDFFKLSFKNYFKSFVIILKQKICGEGRMGVEVMKVCFLEKRMANIGRLYVGRKL